MPLISVILPTRKRNHLLPRALKSLFAQTFNDFEIIIVDDNPLENRIVGDRSLEPFLKNPRIRVIENPIQRNAATARNCALRIASGKWITYLDDDDAYRPTKLESQWKWAANTGLPLGLCGLIHHLSHRTRTIQTTKTRYSGIELLLDAIADTKAIFHLNSGNVFFNELLFAGEDAYFFLQLVKHFGIEEVFNVPEALIDVYPQHGPRVNLNAAELWVANEAIYRDFQALFGKEASQIYLMRARLHQMKFERSEWKKMIQLSIILIQQRGTKDLRAIFNAFLFKIPALRKFLVS